MYMQRATVFFQKKVLVIQQFNFTISAVTARFCLSFLVSKYIQYPNSQFPFPLSLIEIGPNMTTKSKMFLLAVCFSLIVSISSQSLWKDSYEVNEDRERLRNGDNLIYAIAGTESFLTSSVDQILTTFQSSSAREMTKSISAGVIPALQVVDLQCMDLASSSNPLKQFQDFIREKKFKSNSGTVSSSATPTDTELPYQWTEIFVVYNLDTLLTSSDLKKLDFLFRITDKSFEFANVAVVLLWDLDQRALPTSTTSSSPGESLKDRLASVWKVGAPLVNGDALVGRIARTVMERTAMVLRLPSKVPPPPRRYYT